MSNAIVPLDRMAWAELEVDEAEIFKNEARMSKVAHQALADRLRDIGETMAEDLNLDCVHVTEHRDARGFRRTYVARWMPKPGSPAELVGGANDGRQIRVREASDGIPERTLRMPVERPLSAFDAPLDPTPMFNDAEVYELAGFRNDSARWVYRA